MNTKTKILAALKDGESHTLTELTRLTKSTKVSTRISDLRREGYDIRNTREWRNGRFFRSTYQMAKLHNQTYA